MDTHTRRPQVEDDSHLDEKGRRRKPKKVKEEKFEDWTTLPSYTVVKEATPTTEELKEMIGAVLKELSKI